MASKITGISLAYSTICSGADKKNQSPESLDFVREIHRWPVNSRTKGQLHGKCFHLVTSSWCLLIPFVMNRVHHTKWYIFKNWKWNGIYNWWGTNDEVHVGMGAWDIILSGHQVHMSPETGDSKGQSMDKVPKNTSSPTLSMCHFQYNWILYIVFYIHCH